MALNRPLTVTSAQSLLFWFATLMTGGTALSFIFAKALRLPLEPHQATCLLQITLPVFVGYLFQFTRFALRAGQPPTPESNSHLTPLATKVIWVPPVLAATILVAALGLFVWTNQPDAVAGSGMTYDDLATSVTIAVSLLALTTTLAVERLTA